MTTTAPTATHNGAILVEGGRPGTYQILRCSWLVRVATNNPEPDFFSDTFKDVDCGAVMREAGPDGAVCDHGHAFGTAAPTYGWETEDAEIGPWNSLAHVC